MAKPTPLYYLHLGTPTAPPLLFLHGLGSSSADWELQIPAFEKNYHLLLPDLPGHGRTPLGAPLLTVERMAEGVARWLEQLAVPPAHVVGLSMGGCAALALTIQHPQQVRSLTLVNTFARYRPVGWRGAGRVMQRISLLCFAPMRSLAQFIAGGLFPKPEQRLLYEEAVTRLSRNSRATYFSAMWALRRFDARARAQQIHCPTFIITGDRDRTVPLACAAELAQLIPQAHRLTLTDSGHASPMDQFEVFNRSVGEFLAKQ